MLEIMTIIGLACLTNLFIHSEPTIRLRKMMYKSFYNDYQPDDKWIYRLLECAMCSGFWIGLIFTFEPLTACIISVLSELISQKLISGI